MKTIKPTQHTPAPWTIEKPQKGQDGFPHNLNINYEATQRAVYIASIPGAVHINEAEANARLIAAAPELLEACENVIKYHRDNDSGEGELYGLDFITTCVNAVRKAKGRINENKKIQATE